MTATRTSETWRTGEAPFRDRLSVEARHLLAGADGDRPGALALIDRAIAWCEHAGIEACNFTLLQAGTLGLRVPDPVPEACSATIPPVARRGQHRRIDEYVLQTPWRTASRAGVFVDLGCGFPPLASVDTAEALGAHWEVIGVDLERHPALPPDANDQYACPTGDGGIRSERSPLARFSMPNLRFVRGDVRDVRVGEIDVVRCFNVLAHFDQEFRARALAHLASQLKPGGLLLCGTDGTDTSAAHYSVYRLERGTLMQKEFAFGIDNIRPVSAIPFLSFHDGNPEMARLADVVAVLRADETFRRDYDAALDRILEDLQLCARAPDGTLGGVPPGTGGDDLDRRLAAIEARLSVEGWVGEAIATLRRHGVDAWANCAGHVGVGPHAHDIRRH